MKTKLLKKIRKRYSITRIDELASNAGNVYVGAKHYHGLPFYVLEDAKDDWDIDRKFFKTFEEAREMLCEWIIFDYGEKFRHKPEKSTKVWWNK